ncbi:vesicle-associated membrane protein 722-like isoform X2 [Malus domestica]|uniref:vesicle-associated membrane protein 722-like isoform X2 n=1 Tax=Malus domestica TaxID=3750 RepID=UPI00397501AE
MGRKIPLAFLDQIKKDFTARFGGGLAVATVQNSLNKDFRSKLKECMRHAEVKAAQASKDKGVTMENIEKDDEDDDDDDEDNDKEEDDDGDDEEDEY